MHLVNVQTRPMFKSRNGRIAGVKLRKAALVSVTDTTTTVITPNGMTWHVANTAVSRNTLAR